ncbi:MAG TPA: amino acid adenylation domain-containing protein [Streptosporangiaceae bacterium]|nr:amino acid adenylation domain-containing protein [Streptosporangiaceae bacterium]
MLMARASRQPGQIAYTFIGDGQDDETITYAALDQRARSIAGQLSELRLRGQPVMLLYPPGMDYIAAFFGCLYAGAIAVPAYPPDPLRLDRSLPRLAAVIRDASPAAAMTTAAIGEALPQLAGSMAELADLPLVATDQISPGLAQNFEPAPADATSMALLQYTSGSTSAPKGVVLTHENLAANSELIRRFSGHSGQSRGMMWLPPYHDMGLIGGIIQPLYVGFPIALMAPGDFLRRPLSWLEAISRTRATTSGGPNFAYDLCVRKTTPEERSLVDLSSWQVAFNGAEPVRAQTMERFARAFEPAGFRRETFYPCYGLAEATLIVTGGVPWSGDEMRSPAVTPADVPGAGPRRRVTCGRVLPGQRVAIVDPGTGTEQAPGQTGEIWISGSSVARSYWRQPEATRKTFEARLAGTSEGPFLRSGDLGFVSGDQLFVTGRVKDLIIVRGRNHYPHDIEATAERSSPMMRPGCGAAFTVADDDQERLVIAHEVARGVDQVNAGEVAGAIRAAVAEEHGVRVDTVVLLPPGTIPKTSSGKIQRHQCLAMFEAGTLTPLARDDDDGGAGARDGRRALDKSRLLAAPAAQRPGLVRDYLCDLAAAECGIDADTIATDAPLFALGIDSLAITGIQHSIETDLGVRVTLSYLADAVSLTGLAARLGEQVEADGMSPATQIPVSPGQRSLWFLHELEPGSAAHTIAVAMRLRGELDVAALQSALDALVRRHASLRATFPAVDGAPVQRIAATARALLRQHDARDLVEAALTERLEQAAREPFDLARGPLLRIDLYRAAPGETVVLVAAHHIITDFWSMTVLVRELEALYAERTGGAPARLPEPAATYADFVAWQQRTLGEEAGQRLGHYWHEQLQGAAPRLRLPGQVTASEPPPAAGSAPDPGGRDAAAICRLRFGESLLGRLKERARSESVTLPMLMLTAFQLLLHRYTGQDDLSVGMPAAGRGRPEFEAVVGYCMNPVVIRSTLRGGEPVRAALRQTRTRVIGALEHQEYPLPLVAADRGARELFQAMFVFNRPPTPGEGTLALLMMGQPGLRRGFGGLQAEAVPLDIGAAAHDLELTVAEVDNALLGSFRYHPEVLDQATAAQMMRHLEAIAEAIAENAAQPADSVPMLRDDERRRIVAGWQATARDYDVGANVAGLFERQADAAPDAIAVEGESSRVTYGELNENANRIAHFLRRRGVRAGARVGVYVDRSPRMVAALMGVLRAGAAYVPVDPAHPRDRVAAMFADAGVTIVLSQAALASRLPGEIEAVLLDDGWAALMAHPEDNPGLATPADGAAYVIYTSGSTGTPKGVQVGHRSLTNYTLSAVAQFGLAPGDRVLQFASVGFDASAEEIYPALASGATVVLRNDWMLSSAQTFLATCAQWRINVLDLPTAYWHELVTGIAGGQAAVPASLRLVIIGGERAWPRQLRAWRKHVGDSVRLVNTYGPTEATIVATTGELTGIPAGGDVPIGRPVANVTAYVLDPAGEPAPPGAAGELYLGGAGIAYGYLNRPDLTSTRFVPDPFRGGGSRMYRTGDLACYLQDGNLVFLGRADRQIKLRGYRVEPGEIEGILRQLPGVADALVTQHGAAGQLVGYLVTNGDGAPDPARLRGALREKLPGYMVPSSFVAVGSFPRTPNGKVDLDALPPPRLSAPEPTAPRTPAEEFLVRTFTDVLGLPAVGVHDDFFDRGGTSLLAARVVARIREHFSVDVPLRSIFECATPAALAELVGSAPPGTAGPQLPPIRGVPRDQPLPLSFVQEQVWFLQRLAPESTAYNVPRALRVRGEFDQEKVALAFAALERRHEILRTTFPDHGGQPVQVIHPPRGIPVQAVDLECVPEGERDDRIRQFILDRGQEPFDLATGPLIRLALLRLGPADHVLIMVEHHLVHDGWAQGVLLRDFLELYQAQVLRRPAKLPELAVQYADYAAWQRENLRGEQLDALLDFWTAELEGAPPVLTLPTDRARPQTLTFEGQQESLVIEGEFTTALRSFGQERRATLFMTMLTGFSVLLHRYAAQADMVVGVGIANRQRPEAENLLGMMINTVLVRVDASGTPSFEELLGRVRERCLQAYAHQDMPFSKLVERLAPRRSLSRMPLCQVLFSFLDTPMPALQIPGLSFEVIEAHNRSAKFDLNVVVVPGALPGGGQPQQRLDGAITVLMEYNADVFEAETVRRMLGDLRTIFTTAIAQPQRPVGDFLPDLVRPSAVAQDQVSAVAEPAPDGGGAPRKLASSGSSRVGSWWS